MTFLRYVVVPRGALSPLATENGITGVTQLLDLLMEHLRGGIDQGALRADKTLLFPFGEGLGGPVGVKDANFVLVVHGNQHDKVAALGKNTPVARLNAAHKGDDTTALPKRLQRLLDIIGLR